jgi:hypothetical protein
MVRNRGEGGERGRLRRWMLGSARIEGQEKGENGEGGNPDDFYHRTNAGKKRKVTSQ